MKINVNYTDEMIKQLIINDLAEKLPSLAKMPEIKIKVRSKQNYREKDWESGELNCELEVDI